MHSLALLVTALAALRIPGPLSQRTASYRIEASLDEKTDTVAGKETLTWRNDGTAPTSSLPIHLYMNAFKNDASAFMTEQPVHLATSKWGSIEVRDVTVRRGGMVVGARFEVPKAGDETVATLALDAAIAPGETIEVGLAFTTRLPEIFARTGARAGFYAVAQWYPSVGVWECTPTCAWNAAQHHAESEFYADFGTFDVTLDLPSQLGVAATGVRTRAEAHGTRQTLVYRAEDVHDFVFAADARFVEHAADVDDGSGLAPVHVVVMSEPELASNVDRHIAAVRAGLRVFGEHYGYYPYAQLTIVQVPASASAASGMEYPTLFFTFDDSEPTWTYDAELTTLHELAHQWFQGLLASDEVHEAWLDEGLAEYATSRVLALMTPPAALLSRFDGHELSYESYARSRLQRDFPDAMDTPAYAFSSPSAYAHLSYRKPALLLATLQARLGVDELDRRLRTYVDTNRWKHPHRADFIAAFEGIDAVLHQLLDDAIGKPGVLDYAVSEVTSHEVYPTAGLVDADGGAREVVSPPTTGSWHSRITVVRVGEYVLPVTVRARFADGSERDRRVDPGARRWERIDLDGSSRLVEARLYPTEDTPLDVDPTNDGLRLDADPTPRRTLVGSLELVLACLLSWVAR